MLVLDTNVVSELMRPEPHAYVHAWIAAQPLAAMAVATITIMEIRYGLARLPSGRRRRRSKPCSTPLLRRGFGDRILPFDEPAAHHAAFIRAERDAMGRPIATEDSMIAAIARSRNATIVTRDQNGFTACGVPVIDPWRDGG
jgi:predicted nucleic acid-binding protein